MRDDRQIARPEVIVSGALPEDHHWGGNRRVWVNRQSNRDFLCRRGAQRSCPGAHYAHVVRLSGQEWGRGTVAEEVRAEMVANVWKVVVGVGDTVSAGDTLVILDSMKMEIPVLSEDGGRVARIAVQEGDVVQEGDLIALLDGLPAA